MPMRPSRVCWVVFPAAQGGAGSPAGRRGLGAGPPLQPAAPTLAGCHANPRPPRAPRPLGRRALGADHLPPQPLTVGSRGPSSARTAPHTHVAARAWPRGLAGSPATALTHGLCDPVASPEAPGTAGTLWRGHCSSLAGCLRAVRTETFRQETFLETSCVGE